ncbi:hypothetical protein A0J61_09133 [Choanephora cucurbitarum]|uniref:Uncharacterized protein n=1 Tax=Choanephora cucurbitarum TaxID=101091 RepID=A0A1C7N2H0_9FUNG|nr:hypothetical protein A0J61_09133 [Choanephora cucurbitarum]
MPKNDKAHMHNHSLDDANLMSSSEGRKNNLNLSNAKKISIGIEQSSTSSKIQESISNVLNYNKLLIHDINNMRYETKQKRHYSLRASEKAVTDLINQIEDEDFSTEYAYNSSGYLTSIFFANDYMIEKAKRFNEVIVIYATYGTKNLKMPLICA